MEQGAGISLSPGTIGVPTAENGRSRLFDQCLAALDRPAGTTLRYGIHGSVAKARNVLVEQMTGEWLWMIDDDHVFAADTLTRLLRHLDDPRVDAVVPFCLRKQFPATHVLFSLNSRWTRDDTTQPITLRYDLQPHERGLIEVGAAGTAGMLVRRRVFDQLEPPWFELGQVPRYRDFPCEDVWFCRRLRDAGFRLFCDLETPLGHITPIIIWPTRSRQGHTLQWPTGDPARSALLIRENGSVDPSTLPAAALAPGKCNVDNGHKLRRPQGERPAHEAANGGGSQSPKAPARVPAHFGAIR